MKAAIVGAGSFVGARLIESFQLGAGPSLAAVVRHPAELTAAARFAIDLRVADFLEVDSLARSLTGCSAAIYIPPIAPAAEMKRGSAALCRAAAQAGVRRIVFVGSTDVHGFCPPSGTTEKTPLNTHHPEDSLNALVLAERQFFAECRQLNLAGYALRAGYLYGPRVPSFAQLAQELTEEHACLLQSGNGICNAVYIDHLVAAILLALKTKASAGSAFIVGDPDTVTWRSYYHAIAAELNASTTAIRHLEDPAAEPALPESIRFTRTPFASSATPLPTAPPLSPEMISRQLCTWKLPIARASRELGYHPATSFAEAIRRSCAWWRFAHGEFFAAA